MWIAFWIFAQAVAALVSPVPMPLTGWMWIVSNTFTGAAVSLGFAYYLTATFPGLPANVVAAILCLAFTALNFFGARKSARLNTVLVILKLLILVFFSVSARKLSNWNRTKKPLHFQKIDLVA